jgi:crotonobetainyl-CoA:carnitine CoA-transferase CaiB-like acyl-CoA transferase
MLSGVRILSLTNYWAGPSAVRLLTDMGAEAIKVEAIGRPDPSRGPKAGAAERRDYPCDELGPDPWNRAPRFNERHLGSLGLTLDLASQRGRELFLRLVEISDVVIENFSARVMTRLGLDYAELRKAKPDVILVSMPGFGVGGPWKDFISFGPTLEYISGLASLTGYESGDARLSGILVPDFIGALHGASAVLAALHHRRRTGEGTHVELSQLECALSLVGEELLTAQLATGDAKPLGNRHATLAPHGVYPCKGASAGEEAWIALTVTCEREWTAFCGMEGLQSLASDSRFATPLLRKTHEDELDALIVCWSGGLGKYQAAYRMQQAGVPAAPVLSARDHFGDPQVLARGMLTAVDHPSAGRRIYHGVSWKTVGGEDPTLGPAPRLGEHNELILGSLLGLDSAQIEALRSEGVIGEAPL